MKYVLLLNGKIMPLSEPTSESNEAYYELYSDLVYRHRVFNSEYDAH